MTDLGELHVVECECPLNSAHELIFRPLLCRFLVHNSLFLLFSIHLMDTYSNIAVRTGLFLQVYLFVDGAIGLMRDTDVVSTTCWFSVSAFSWTAFSQGAMVEGPSGDGIDHCDVGDFRSR